MKKVLKRTLSVLLIVVMVLGITSFNGFCGIGSSDLSKVFGVKAEAASVTEYKVGDIIEFGSYPQSEVTDKILISELNSLELEWVSYNYYSGNKKYGSMVPSDYMKYADAEYNGIKYRAVTFSDYRPYMSVLTHFEDYSRQYSNGYRTNTVYWFKFEPLEWKVLDPKEGLVLCKTIIDSQAYSNTVYSSEYGVYFYNDASKTIYVNDYSTSSIREWLNDDFYNTAFSESERSKLQVTKLDNKAYSDPKYDSDTTYDKVFLLSHSDVCNTDYGFSDSLGSCVARQAQSSDYAECQGLRVRSWLLRTPGTDSRSACNVDSGGDAFFSGINGFYTDYGIRPAIKLSELKPKGEYQIAVYTTQPSLMIDIGEKMGIGFALSKDGEIEEDWKNMAIVVSNPTIVDVSDYLYSEQGYYINFTGKSEGTTTVTVTDSDSGAYVTFLIKVVSEDAMCCSYKIDEIPEYYPEIWGCRETKTNFYDVSGLYVNQYKQGTLNSNGKYPVSFNVYNSEYHFGSVDVYDANGKWMQSVCIDKYAQMPESVLETADQLFYLITDGLNFDWFSYEANHYAKKTTIKIEVPKGGYFTITNNFANSPGTILYNAADLMSSVLSGSITLVNMNNAVDDVIEDIISDDAVYDAFMSALMNIGVNTANQAWTVGTAASSNAFITDIEGLFESLGLGFDSFCSTAAGIAQDVFLAFDTPFGKALEVCFNISDLSNMTCQMLDLLNSDNNVYLAIHTNESAHNRVMNGVIVDDNGNMIDREAVLQVFRVTDKQMKDIVISNDTTLKFDDYVTYNICFVKGETEVQPNGKVQVRIPIPEGMDKSDCCILREEKNGKWTVLSARIEGDYLVFETDHFSLYAVAGNYADSIKIKSMPSKLEYDFGEYIDTTDMSIMVTYDDGRTETITDGIICTPVRLAESGTQIITVSYGKTTTTFTVEVDSNIKLSVAVANPSTTKISYGDSIILHAEIMGELPEGATVQWNADNSCFDKAASNDGMTCRITPKSSGNTTFTVKIVSADGEVISEDTQEMTAKAGFFDKIIGFFKSLFGLSKIIEQAFNPNK